MPFKKGHTPWNKGKNQTQDVKDRVSNTLKQKYKSGELLHSMKGKHHTLKTRKKLRDIKLKQSTNNYINAKGYRIVSYFGTQYAEHKVVWMQSNNMPVPKGCIIHHKNMNKLDNRIENLVLLPKDYHDELHWEIRRRGG